jgi:hypothetical protein
VAQKACSERIVERTAIEKRPADAPGRARRSLAKMPRALA